MFNGGNHMVLDNIRISSYSFEEYVDLARSFHGYAAPGIILGGFMVDLAMKNLPDGELFDAVCETTACLPDAIQLLTPCTLGNGWLKVFDFNRYALTMYNKENGRGVRVALSTSAVRAWPNINEWFFKLKPKREQDSQRLMEEIRDAGCSICKVEQAQVSPEVLRQKSRGDVAVCTLCGESFRTQGAGTVCRACHGEAYYRIGRSDETLVESPRMPALKSTPVEQAVGLSALHDMTEIIPGKLKKPAFKRGQELSIGDVCHLQRMGKNHIYLSQENPVGGEWVNEDQAATAFAGAMTGPGVAVGGKPSEGKVNLEADMDGLLVIEVEQLKRFNLVPEVMCACLKNFTQVSKGQKFAATRAIPLYLSRENYTRALDVLAEKPLFKVLPMRKASVGLLVTGEEVARGLVEDRFIPILEKKLKRYDCRIVGKEIVPDDRGKISSAVTRMIQSGADMVIATAGMSVDPDDCTRQGIIDAGATQILYGAPILPGAMTLLAQIGSVQVVGVPACALYFDVTSFDLLLPRLLAGVPVTREDLAQMGHGSFCQECKVCVFPRCSVGR